MGAALTQGSGGMNIGRLAGLAGGLPVTVAGMTLDRQCSSGMYAIATAANAIRTGDANVMVAGGLDSISLVQNKNMNMFRAVDPALVAKHKDIYMPMLQTAEVVANRYNISRDVQDEYGYQSQMRTAAAQDAGKFDDEIVPITAQQALFNIETGETSFKEVTLSKDEGNRPQTTLEGLNSLNPVIEGGCITAGNASQLSDGASATVMMDEHSAAQGSVQPLGIYRELPWQAVNRTKWA